MAASLILGGHPFNTTIKTPFPAALSRSATCKALSRPFPALSLSLSSSSLPVQQKKSSRSYLIYCAAAGLTSSWLVNQAAEDVNQQLYWFEKEMMEAKEMIQKLRKDHEMTIHKLLLDEDDKPEEKAILLADMEVMFWHLSDKQAKTIRTKVKARYISEKPITKWQVKDFSVGVNRLLDWFDKETTEAKEMTDNLRKEYETIIQKILDEEDLDFLLKDSDDTEVLLKDLREMFWKLEKKYVKAIIAKVKVAKLEDEVSMAAKLLYPFFVL